MKKLFYFILGVVFISCSETSNEPLPIDIDYSSIKTESKPGAIRFQWSTPDDANYKYVKLSYVIPDGRKECVRLASKYADTLLVDHLLNRYGELEFDFQVFTAGGQGGSIHKVKASALPAEKMTKVDKSSILVDKAHVWTDSEQADDGPLKNLVDGDPATFFHMRWQSATDYPHYIVIDMQKEIRSLQFSYQCRNHGNKDNPKSINVYGSNEFDGKKFVPSDFSSWKLSELRNLPDTKAALFQSETIVSDKSFRYVWLEITESTSGKWWVALAELSLYKIKMSSYDPETGETTVIE